MQPLFYHDRRTGFGSHLRRVAGAMAVCGASAAGCGRPAPPPAPPATAAITPGAAASATPETATPATPTASAIASGRALMDRVRAAAGGPALTALRSFEVTGTSAMTGMKVLRTLRVIALFPMYYRQEETTSAGLTPAFNTAIGLEGERGYLTGALLGGDGKSKDLDVQRRTYARAARQAMAGFLTGINAPWLLDTGKFTATDGGVVDAGADRGALMLVLDGPDGRVGRLLIDPDTHLPRRLIQPPQPGGGGTAAVADIVFTYSDFQPQGGLQLPHTIVRENGRNRTVWSLTQYRLNPRLPPRRFNQTPR